MSAYVGFCCSVPSMDPDAAYGTFGNVGLGITNGSSVSSVLALPALPPPPPPPPPSRLKTKNPVASVSRKTSGTVNEATVFPFILRCPVLLISSRNAEYWSANVLGIANVVVFSSAAASLNSLATRLILASVYPPS